MRALRSAPVDPTAGAELPGLRMLFLDGVELDRAADSRTPRELGARLAALADRFRGARAITLREEPVTSAYRRFFRQVGIDPDREPTPMERAARARIMRGGFPSQGLLADALLAALVDTSIPVWAIDADRLAGELRVATSAGRLVVADTRGPVAPLFGDVGAEHAVDGATRRLVLFTLLVPGVPDIYASEALESCAASLSEPSGR